MTFKLKDIFGQNKRTALIRKNILFSFLIKGWSGLVTLLLVPLTLHCLGEYTNGVWLTISSILIWLDNMDIGLGNGLRNKLATFIANDDIEHARQAVSSTFFMLMIIVLPAILILCLLVDYTDVYSFLNIDSTIIPGLRKMLIVSLIFVGSTFIFKFIGNFYLGLQLPAVNNFFVTSGHTLALLGTYILYVSNSHSLMMIAIVNTASPLIVYLLSYPYTFFYKYKELRPSFSFFNSGMISQLFSLGIKFFLLQVCSTLIFLSSNILMSRFFSPVMVTPYQIAYRYFSVVMMIFTVVCAPNWTATTDAFARGDIAWIKNRREHMQKVIYIFALLLFVMVMIAKYVYPVWMHKDVNVPVGMNIFVAVYILVLIWSMSYCFFLNGVGALKLQLYCTVGAGLLFIPLTLVVSRFTDNVAFIIVTMILVNIPSLVVNMIQLHKILNGTAKGVWAK